MASVPYSCSCAAGEPSGIGIVPRFSRILPRIGDARKDPTIRTFHLVRIAHELVRALYE
jgi:hypothetical protein